MGNTENKNYVAKITVEGTDIKEYYTFDEPVTEEEAKRIWLDDLRDNKSLGLRLHKTYADRVEVELLWQTRSEEQEQEKRTNQARLPPAEEEGDEETSM